MKCQNCKTEFEITDEDRKFYKKIDVPEPTWCPDCRLQRRFTFLNQRSLYRRECDLCRKKIISMYHDSVPFPVYCPDCWWSDKWNPPTLDYDFNKPFFEQTKKLSDKTPRMSLMGIHKTWINSEYNNMAHQLKNCYLLFNSDYNEDCSYGSEVERSKDCIDMLMSDSSELSYSSVNALKSYRVFYSVDCEDCQDVWFSKNLVNCQNCFGCVNLRNKQNHIFNKEYSKEDYAKKIKEFDTGSYQNYLEILKKVGDFQLDFPNKYIHGRHNSNVSGDYINHSKNVFDSYIVIESENCRYCMWLIVKNNKDCYDYTQFGENTQSMYEDLVCGIGANNVKFSFGCVSDVINIQYSQDCRSSSNLFGCYGLTKKQNCILNKQYSKEEYDKMIPKIIKHMDDMPYKDKKGRMYKYGEFFPPELSCFGYNETTAQEYFSLDKGKAVEQGYLWYDKPKAEHQPTIQAKDLPDHIKDIGDDIGEQVIGCEHQGKCNEQCTIAFKLVPQEIEFYKKNNIPLPRLCPNCRHYQRLKLRNPIKLWHRKCMKKGCDTEFETSYAPDRKEIVYCEECYNKEVG